MPEPQQNESRPNAIAKQKDGDVNSPYAKGRKTMTDFFIAVFAALAVISGAVLGIVGIFTHWPSKYTIAIWSLYFTIVFALATVFLVWQKRVWEAGTPAAIAKPVTPEPPRYAASYSVAIIPARGERSLKAIYWLAYNSRVGKTISPIPIMLFVRVENLHNTLIKIDAYTIDAKNKKGEWVRLWKMDTVSGSVYVLADSKIPKAVARIDLSDDGFAQALSAAKQQSAPGRPLEGWIALDHPDGFDDGTPFRINIRDKVGEVTIPVTGPEGDAAVMKPEKSTQSFRGYVMGLYSDVVGK